MDDLRIVSIFLSLKLLKTLSKCTICHGFYMKDLKVLTIFKKHKLGSVYNTTNFLSVYFIGPVYSLSHLYLIMMLKLKGVPNVDELW